MNKNINKELLLPLSVIALSFAFFGAVQGIVIVDRLLILFVYFYGMLIFRVFYFGDGALRVEAYKEHLYVERVKLLFAGTHVRADRVKNQRNNGATHSPLFRFVPTIVAVLIAFIGYRKLDLSYWYFDLGLLVIGQLLAFSLTAVHLRFCLILVAIYQIGFSFFVEYPDPLSLSLMMLSFICGLILVNSFSRLGMVGRRSISFFDVMLTSTFYLVFIFLIFNGINGVLPKESGDKTLFQSIGFEEYLEKNWDRLGPKLIKLAQLPLIRDSIDIGEAKRRIMERYEEQRNTKEFREFTDRLRKWARTSDVLPAELIKDRLQLVEPVRAEIGRNDLKIRQLKKVVSDPLVQENIKSGKMLKQMKQNKEMLYQLSMKPRSEVVALREQLSQKDYINTMALKDFVDSTNFQEKYENYWLKEQIIESDVRDNHIDKYLREKNDEFLPDELKAESNLEKKFEIKALLSELSDLFSKFWGWIVFIVFAVVGFRLLTDVRRLRASQRRRIKKKALLSIDELKKEFEVFRKQFNGSSLSVSKAYSLFVELLRFKLLAKPDYLPPDMFLEEVRQRFPFVYDDSEFISEKFSDVSFGRERMSQEEVDQFKVCMLRIYDFSLKSSVGEETTKVVPTQRA